MVVTRRGRRNPPSYVGKVKNPVIQNERIFKEKDEKLFWMLTKQIKPTADFSRNSGYYRKIYDNLTQTQQKNLIDKIANQILYAHSSVVSKILTDLALLSVDFSQKTEVAFRRSLLEQRTNREA